MKRAKSQTEAGDHKEERASSPKTQKSDNVGVPRWLVALLSSTMTASLCLIVGALVASMGPLGPAALPDYSLSWLQDLEQDIHDQIGPLHKRKGAEMQMVWQTPILTFNLHSMGMDVPKFNSKIAAAVLTQYRALQDHNPELGKHSEQFGANQAFYDWQMEGGWNMFKDLKEIKKLESIFQSSSDTFLRTIGQNQELIDQRDRLNIHMWATVHDSCISHSPHSHPNELVSGVYYVRTPKDAGPIVFHDPRGPLPPFDNMITIRPKPGDVVLFPSWLMHQVLPTGGSQERISIPFNIPGKWEATTSISKSFPVQM